MDMEKQQQQLVEDNINLVYFVIQRYYPHLITDEDVVQVGMLGLCIAVVDYEPEKGEFSTYACRKIRGRISYECRKRRKDRQANIMSLNYEINADDGAITERGDLIVGDEDVDFVDISELYQKASPLERIILELKQQGLNSREIAKAIGGSEERVSCHLRKLRKMYGRMYER